MKKFTGKGVCGSAAVGKVKIIRHGGKNTAPVKITDVQSETARFEAAKRKASEQLTDIYRKALAEAGEDEAGIFEIHMMMLDDEDFCGGVLQTIREQGVNAEYAVACTADRLADSFSSMDNAYMQARSADIKDISSRIIRCLENGGEESGDVGEGVIICADDLAPSETVSLDKNSVLAFATAYGTPNSHTAILARSMNIPAVIGVGSEMLGSVSDGDTAIADGSAGVLIVNPDEKTAAEYKARQSRDQEKRERLLKLKGKADVTADGRKIDIFANAGSIDNVSEALLNDAGGIGLFRSEFLYMNDRVFPDEERQFNAYRQVLEIMSGKKVIIRTLDIGADKQTEHFAVGKEENPALGLRAIRFCLTHREIFRTQLRALYRASAYGKLGIMFPMITGENELREALELCGEVRNELAAEGKKYSDKTEIGIMIETPAAAVISDRLAPMVDFFSVGTNDLTQYTLACDRQNADVERFCDPYHEAVMRLIRFAADSAHSNGKWIGVCGELAADTAMTEKLLEMGIDELSVPAPLVLELRARVRGINAKK